MIAKQSAAGIAILIGLFNLVEGNAQVCIFFGAIAILIAMDAANDPH